MTRLPLRPFVGACLVALLSSSCSDDDDPQPVAIADSLSAYPTLLAALEATGLDVALRGDGPFTLLAPSEAAFTALGSDVVAALLAEPGLVTLTEILEYHVLTTEARADVVETLTTATTLQGAALNIDVVDGTIFVNDAEVTTVNLGATNGVIHVIDTVLQVPDSIAATLTARGFDTLVAAVTEAGLATTLSDPGTFTVLAPTEAAFAALPAGALDTLLADGNEALLTSLLQYHVVGSVARASDAVGLGEVEMLNGEFTFFELPSTGPEVNGIAISRVNIPCTNGIIHVIDAVLTDPEPIPALATAAGFDTLVTALGAASLVDTLNGDGPFTVFAPTDDAFAALPDGVLDSLLADVPALSNVLLYHVVGDRVRASELMPGTPVTTLQTSEVSVELVDGGLQIGGANVLTADVVAANGVVHAIDAVLLPPAALVAAGGDVRRAWYQIAGLPEPVSVLPFEAQFEAQGAPAADAAEASDLEAASTVASGLGGGAADRANGSAVAAQPSANVGSAAVAGLALWGATWERTNDMGWTQTFADDQLVEASLVDGEALVWIARTTPEARRIVLEVEPGAQEQDPSTWRLFTLGVNGFSRALEPVFSGEQGSVAAVWEFEAPLQGMVILQAGSADALRSSLTFGL